MEKMNIMLEEEYAEKAPKLLKSAREGWTQSEASLLTGVPKATISNWEQGRRLPPAYLADLYVQRLVNRYVTYDGNQKFSRAVDLEIVKEKNGVYTFNDNERIYWSNDNNNWMLHRPNTSEYHPITTKQALEMLSRATNVETQLNEHVNCIWLYKTLDKALWQPAELAIELLINVNCHQSETPVDCQQLFNQLVQEIDEIDPTDKRNMWIGFQAVMYRHKGAFVYDQVRDLLEELNK